MKVKRSFKIAEIELTVDQVGLLDAAVYSASVDDGLSDPCELYFTRDLKDLDNFKDEVSELGLQFLEDLYKFLSENDYDYFTNKFEFYK